MKEAQKQQSEISIGVNNGGVPIDAVRHSLAHLLAMSVLKKFPKAKLGIGPVVENGFYYDFKFAETRGTERGSTPISEKDLPELEATMRELIGAKLPITGKKVTPAVAKKLFSGGGGSAFGGNGQPFKLDLIKDFIKEKKQLTVYATGKEQETSNKKQKTKRTTSPYPPTPIPSSFTDLCRGGHIRNTDEINPDAFKLTTIAGAYWRGDEKKAQLTRIYGVAFATKQELDAHVKQLEEARKRDHRKLGQDLGLFVFSDLVGPGLPLYTPRGMIILQEIKNFSRSLRKEIGYEEVQTPNMNKGELFRTSGHYEKFKNDMFLVKSHYSEEEYFLKPMNCPQHIQLYSSEPRSYRDLPIKYADFAMLYRDEKPGELLGLTRLRSFTQDDGHCFLREDQIEQEFVLVLGAIRKAMKKYGLNYYIRLSLRDEKNTSAYLGNDAVWIRSQSLLKKLLEEHNVECTVAEGEAAFYGPKMDLMIRDSLGRQWQLSTIQLDFNMPARFGASYIDANGKKEIPVMIHSALVGSPERFFGILIEHYAGAFPFWMAPVQVSVLPISDKVTDYAKDVMKQLSDAGIRAWMDDRNETVGRKIREAELQKIPYLLVVGPREAESKTVAVRERGKGDLGQMSLEKAILSFR